MRKWWVFRQYIQSVQPFLCLIYYKKSKKKRDIQVYLHFASLERKIFQHRCATDKRIHALLEHDEIIFSMETREWKQKSKKNFFASRMTPYIKAKIGVSTERKGKWIVSSNYALKNFFFTFYFKCNSLTGKTFYVLKIPFLLLPSLIWKRAQNVQRWAQRP